MPRYLVHRFGEFLPQPLDLEGVGGLEHVVHGIKKKHIPKLTGKVNFSEEKKISGLDVYLPYANEVI